MKTFSHIFCYLVTFLIVTLGLAAAHLYIGLNDWSSLSYWVWFILAVVIVGGPAWTHWLQLSKKWFKL